MNSSRFNKSSLVSSENVDEDGVMDEALSDVFLSIYLKIMIDKHCESVSSSINDELDNRYAEEMVQCKKLMCILKRETHATAIFEETKFMEDDHKSLSSLSDVSDDALNVMNPLKSEFEKLLSQLPLKGFQMPSDCQQVAMIQKLKACDEVLKKYNQHFSEELMEKSHLSQHLKNTLDSDLLPRKEKCDSLMEAISNMSIKESADISARTANELLGKKRETSDKIGND